MAKLLVKHFSTPVAFVDFDEVFDVSQLGSGILIAAFQAYILIVYRHISGKYCTIYRNIWSP